MVVKSCHDWKFKNYVMVHIIHGWPRKMLYFHIATFSSIIAFIIESPIIAIVPLGHSPLLLFWFLSYSLLLTLFLNL